MSEPVIIAQDSKHNRDLLTVAFALLLLVFAVQIGLYVNDFYVADGDFFEYRERAVEIRQSLWPQHAKRPPLYSALIAGLSAPFSGKHRELYVAEVISVVSGLLSLWLLLKISRFSLGVFAFPVLWVWASHFATLRMIIKPKPDIVLTLLILWAFERFMRGDKRCYLVAFLATLFRYEGLLAIAAFAGADFILGKGRRLKTIAYAVLSAGFVVIWTLVNSRGTGGASYGNYFSDYKPAFVFLETFWGALLTFLPIQGFKAWAAGSLILCLLGVWYGLRNFPRFGLAVSLFFMGYFAMHVAWPFASADYVVHASWAALLLMGWGVAALFSVVKKSAPHLWLMSRKLLSQRIFLLFSSALFLMIVLLLTTRKFNYPQYRVSWGMVSAFFAVMAFYLWRMDKSKNKAAAVLCAGLFLFFGFHLNSNTNADLHGIRYSKAEFRLVGEWYQNHYRKGDKMIVYLPKIVAYFTDLDSEQAFVTLVDMPILPPDQAVEWLREQGITYVAWLSSNRIYDKDDAWYAWKRDNRGWRSIAYLQDGEDFHGLHCVETLRNGPRWAYIYTVR